MHRFVYGLCAEIVAHQYLFFYLLSHFKDLSNIDYNIDDFVVHETNFLSLPSKIYVGYHKMKLMSN